MTHNVKAGLLGGLWLAVAGMAFYLGGWALGWWGE